MKLEFLEAGPGHTPLIHLYGVEDGSLREISRQVEQLALQTVQRVEVHNIAGVAAISGCQLTLRTVSRRPRSLVTRSSDERLAFHADATSEDWLTVHELLEPMLQPSSSIQFQWLLGGDARGLLGESSIAFMVSTYPKGTS